MWLEQFLSTDTRTLVLISHDQDFLNRVVVETIVLRNKKLVYFEGTPAAFEVNERKERKRLTGAQAALDKKRDHASCFYSAGWLGLLTRVFLFVRLRSLFRQG